MTRLQLTLNFRTKIIVVVVVVVVVVIVIITTYYIIAIIIFIRVKTAARPTYLDGARVLRPTRVNSAQTYVGAYSDRRAFHKIIRHDSVCRHRVGGVDADVMRYTSGYARTRARTSSAARRLRGATF